MKHKRILDEIERLLKTIPGLRVEREKRQPEDNQDLRDFGPLAILYPGERTTSPVENESGLTWTRRWEMKPIITILISDLDSDEQRDKLDAIEKAFVDALDESPLLQPSGSIPGGLLASGSFPDITTQFRHPDESDLSGMEIFLNFTYER